MKSCFKFYSIVLALTMVMSSQLFAESNPYISNKNPKLNSQQWKAIELANDWIKNDIMPGVGENGKVIFPYGISMPFVIAMPLYPSEIEFEPGEIVKDFHLGDTARWKVTPAISGPDTLPVHRMIIKPVDAGLKTALIVNTNKRSYYIHLISRKTNHMPRVGFTFPENDIQRWQSYFEAQEKRKVANTIPETKENIAELSFEYRIDGKASFKPLRVYNNGIKTIIQMPKSMKSKSAPSLLVLTGRNKQRLVNYRVKGDRYIVDELFDKAILISGVGRNQEKITITKEGL